eukprot:TRINITY_DN5113_c0_g1_i1.p1 TRINITY_DN5113_c0_g1~~TRINITY_DN5113_c0_g1_i1.p1  ORF type:complete len:205 (-),score=-26.55 TRINITY_DN5113_c0_g1_i1:401-1015(-)
MCASFFVPGLLVYIYIYICIQMHIQKQCICCLHFYCNFNFFQFYIITIKYSFKSIDELQKDLIIQKCKSGRNFCMEVYHLFSKYYEDSLSEKFSTIFIHCNVCNYILAEFFYINVYCTGSGCLACLINFCYLNSDDMKSSLLCCHIFRKHFHVCMYTYCRCIFCYDVIIQMVQILCSSSLETLLNQIHFEISWSFWKRGAVFLF